MNKKKSLLRYRQDAELAYDRSDLRSFELAQEIRGLEKLVIDLEEDTPDLISSTFAVEGETMTERLDHLTSYLKASTLELNVECKDLDRRFGELDYQAIQDILSIGWSSITVATSTDYRTSLYRKLQRLRRILSNIITKVLRILKLNRRKLFRTQVQHIFKNLDDTHNGTSLNNTVLLKIFNIPLKNSSLCLNQI